MAVEGEKGLGVSEVGVPSPGASIVPLPVEGEGTERPPLTPQERPGGYHWVGVCYKGLRNLRLTQSGPTAPQREGVWGLRRRGSYPEGREVGVPWTPDCNPIDCGPPPGSDLSPPQRPLGRLWMGRVTEPSVVFPK